MYFHLNIRHADRNSGSKKKPFPPSDRVLNVDHTTAQTRVPALDIQLCEYTRATTLYPCVTYTT